MVSSSTNILRFGSTTSSNVGRKFWLRRGGDATERTVGRNQHKK